MEKPQWTSVTFRNQCVYDGWCNPASVELIPGEYNVELWGSSGANVSTAHGGKGGYISAFMNLTHPVKVYLYVGHEGITNSLSAPYNGGGAAGSMNQGSGGGCTDIRLIPGNSFESLKSRIIVAGSGGGAAIYNGIAVPGGNAGMRAASPGNKAALDPEINLSLINASEGGQNDRGGKNAIDDTNNSAPGRFGKGGFSELAPGGGCGYFGGGAGGSNGNVSFSGAGGSSFVSGIYGFNLIDESSESEENYKMKGEPYHKYINFYKVSLIPGTDDMPTPYGGSIREYGHFGNGYIRITAAFRFMNVTYFSPDCPTPSRINTLLFPMPTFCH